MRAFIAIDLPEELRAALARVQAELRQALGLTRFVRWTRPESIHLTLKFLGEIAELRVVEVTNALRSIEPINPFSIAIGGFGFFPTAAQPRVFWAGLAAPPELAVLAHRIEKAAGAVGFLPETRLFSPHLTLARISGRLRANEIATMQSYEPHDQDSESRAFRSTFSVCEFYLFESRLHTSGAEYRKLARFPLNDLAES